MADVDYRTTNRPSGVAWAALILAILAIIIGWMAYNRTGKDLEDSASEAIDNTSQQVEESTGEAGEAVQDSTDAVEGGVDTGPDGVDDGAQ